MIRDILVTLPTGDATSIALDDAITVAGNFDAHLTGVAFVQDLDQRWGIVRDGCRAGSLSPRSGRRH